MKSLILLLFYMVYGSEDDTYARYAALAG